MAAVAVVWVARNPPPPSLPFRPLAKRRDREENPQTCVACQTLCPTDAWPDDRAVALSHTYARKHVHTGMSERNESSEKVATSKAPGENLPHRGSAEKSEVKMR